MRRRQPRRSGALGEGQPPAGPRGAAGPARTLGRGGSTQLPPPGADGGERQQRFTWNEEDPELEPSTRPWWAPVRGRTLGWSGDDLRERLHDLELLTAFADRVQRSPDSRDVSGLLLATASATTRVARGLVLAGPDGTPALLDGQGLPDAVLRRPGRPAGSAVIAAAQALRATQQVPRGLDPREEPWLSRLLPRAADLVVLPLVADRAALGALVLEQPPGTRRHLSPHVLTTLERSASYAACALRNLWRYEQLERLAATDGLTKIANRRAFETILEREVARATRNAEHVSLVLLDIDDFKLLNDAHGHQAGDEVLRNVAAALSCECRDFDTPARYGGEEFAVLLPGCPPEEAVAIAERLRRAVSAAPAVAPVTASAGVATYPAHAGDTDGLVRAADEALYLSKNRGRDRTSQAVGVPPEAQVEALLRRAVSRRLARPAPGAGRSDGTPPA
jgi:two-component system, cell cycle response regulator